MKAVWGVMLVLLCAQAADAFSPRWRWREDDGDIFRATWKDSLNCPINCQDGKNLRLRTVVAPVDVAPADTPVTVSLRYWSKPYYETWNATQWTPVTRADTGLFFLSDSRYLDDGAWYPNNAALNIWSSESGVPYLGTITIDTSSRYSLAGKPHKGGYEFEYCLKPNAAGIPEGSVFYFVSFLNEGIGVYDADPPSLRFPPFYWTYHKEKSRKIVSMQFIDSLTGWYQEVADHGCGFWRTEDRGETWTELTPRLVSWEFPFYFVTRDTGWAIVEGRLSRSIYGGATWTPVDLGGASIGSSPHSIFFWGTKYGWVTGQSDSLLRTSDGGVTWESIPSPERMILSSHFLNERLGFAIGESIYKTTDGGTSWRLVQSLSDSLQGGHAAYAERAKRPSEIPLQPYVGQIQFIDSSHGWALAHNGKLYRTVDGGENWTLAQTYREPRAMAMHFSDRLNGWIVGEEGMIVATRDGGASWEKRPSGTGHDLLTVAGVRDHLWIGCRDGTVLSSPNGGWVTTVEGKQAAAVPEEFALYQNYPNPFNPSTRIRYALARPAQVKLRIYDVLGREIVTLVDDVKPAGAYETVWNASHYTSGVYFFRLVAGAFAQTRTMALVK